MSECIIAFRDTLNDCVCFVSEEDEDRMAVFPDREAAIAATLNTPVCQVYPWQIIELDEI